MENAEIQFAEKGYEGSSVRDIADRANVNAAVIYYHFKSKEQLYKAIFTLRLAQLNEALRSNCPDESQTSYSRLGSYVSIYIRKIRENFYFHRLLNAEIFSFRDGFFKRSILGSVSGNANIFKEVLKQGIARKEFRPVDIDLFLMSLFHLLHQVIGRSPLASELLSIEEIPEEEMIGRIRDFLFYLLYPQTGISGASFN